MKKIVLTLIFLALNINSSFANASPYDNLSSMDSKLAKLDELVTKGNLTPKQSQIFFKMANEGYTDCSPSTSGKGAICKLDKQYCLISQGYTTVSLKCFKEEDLDKLLSTT